MGAREKLNQIYLFGAFGIAGLLGLATQSFLVFVLVTAVALFGFVHNGDIRPERKSRGSSKHRKRR